MHSVENNGISNFNFFLKVFQFLFSLHSVVHGNYVTMWINIMYVFWICFKQHCLVSAIRLLNGNALWPPVVWFQNTKRETAKILESRLHESTAGSIIKTPHSLRQFLGCHQAWHSWDRFSNNFDTLSYVYLLTDRQYSFDKTEVKLLLLPPVF